MIRAVPLHQPLRVDGVLAEDVYATVPAIADFIQGEPDLGAPATERTEAWVLFTDEYLYVVARCWDSVEGGWIANEMRRDGEQLRRNDSFGVLLDTFHDRRNAFLFYVNPIGGLADELITDERTPNTDWNTVWHARTGRFEGGWTVEIAIPFASLRYDGDASTWGINLRRIIRRKNEYDYVTVMPPASNPLTAIFRVSAAAVLADLAPPSRGLGLELKPYGIAGLNTDRLQDPPVTNDPHSDAGFDVKLAVTEGLTADLTVRTDFAQVEVDEQQINLTRFNLSFPEKREFFLEGRGTFDFGGVRDARAGDVPVLFFSRRIGLSSSGAIPVHAGGRVTGRTGPYSIGLLNVQTGRGDGALAREGAEPANFSVVRLKRDVLTRSSIGVIVTNRSVGASGHGSNQAAGVDALVSLFENLNVNAYVAGTQTTDVGSGLSYRTQLDYNSDRYGLQVERLRVDGDFNPEVGFLRREAFARAFVSGRVSRRPERGDSLRRMSLTSQFDYVTDPDGRVEGRETQTALDVEMENSDRVIVRHTWADESIVEPFDVAGEAVVSPGDYRSHVVRGSYAMGPQRPVSATLAVSRGGFFGGTIMAFEIDQGRVAVTPRLSLEPSLAVNWIDLDQRAFRTTLGRLRVNFTLTPRLFVSVLAQYNSTSEAVGTNVRARWEYQPGSELFVVYTDERGTNGASAVGLRNRALAVKINRLLRF